MDFSTTLLVGCLVSAIGLIVLLLPGRSAVRAGGGVVGLAGLAIALVAIVDRVTPAERVDLILPLVFGTVAVIAATRVISHARPVMAALWFVFVVVAGAGLYLMLGAEFMAFALVIVYAGAILITYMFVLMLAQQSPDAEGAWYDRSPREPWIAILTGFVLLATLSRAMLGGPAVAGPGALPVVDERTEIAARLDAWDDLASMPRLLERVVSERTPDFEALEPDPDGAYLRPLANGDAQVIARLADGTTTTVRLEPADAPGNTRLVGMALVSRFPVSLELAGVILLMAMFGAVVLARKQIELGEDETREIAGMQRVSVDEIDGPGDSR